MRGAHDPYWQPLRHPGTLRSGDQLRIFTILVGPFFSRMLRFFPPVVIGSVITVIGLSLLPVAGAWLGGGDASAPDFGSLTHLGLGFATIALFVAIRVSAGA